MFSFPFSVKRMHNAHADREVMQTDEVGVKKKRHRHVLILNLHWHATQTFHKPHGNLSLCPSVKGKKLGWNYKLDPFFRNKHSNTQI